MRGNPPAVQMERYPAAMRAHRQHFVAMLLLFAFLLDGARPASVDKNLQGVPRWSVELGDSGLRPFDRRSTPRWARQQDVFFLDPKHVGVYQVNELALPAPLGPRGPSGGSGNFFMEIRIFDLENGKSLPGVHFRTNSELSAVWPTHDGQWIARTGDILYLFSADGGLLFSRKLPIAGIAPFEEWQVALSPSAGEAVLVHQQTFSLPEPATEKEGKAKVDVEIVATSNLEKVQSFSVDHPLLRWSPGDGFLIAYDPAKPWAGGELGILDFSGHWTAFRPSDGCKYQITGLKLGKIAAYGCGRLAVFSQAGREMFSVKVNSGEFVNSVAEAEGFLALELTRPEFTAVPGNNAPNVFNKSEQIDVYSLDAGKKVLSVPIRSATVYYSISSGGILAVVQGGSLAVYDSQSPK
jgi:hypothetical protein